MRVGQAETYMVYLLNDPMGDPWLARLRRQGVSLQRVAGGVERSSARADIDRAFSSWAEKEGFTASHIWLRGYVAVALAIRDLRSRTP